jgi:3'-5' exoribonuclease
MPRPNEWDNPLLVGKGQSLTTLETARWYFRTLENTLSPREWEGIQPVLHADAFWKCPASLNKHHTFEGGLAVHTAQVVLAMRGTLQACENSQLGLATVAAVWHDFGKIYEYQFVPYYNEHGMSRAAHWIYTPHRHTITHLPRSYAEFVLANRQNHTLRFESEAEDFIGHLILAHHGRQDWGSPVLPQCPEAWALHAADMLSAQYQDRKVPGA